MTDENIINCISLDDNGKVVNITRGLDQTPNSICVDMTGKLKNVRKGDTLTGDIVLRDTPMGRAYGLRTILNPEWVKKPLTPEELRQKWLMEKNQLENELKDIKFEILFDNVMGLADKLQKDKEIYYELHAKLADLITNEPQG